ncbi:class I SAM-dependent methyltransferase [Petrocella sp. FN5]|uniref:class I SAM-dependent methyltransferase n=1 Tax=Petrocella sp. FN5 TaxID=3032002 RepID=UPI0023DA7E6C|nr:class I SAM-dependent methyltransferase [Petrocella sp. FN5]MDF1617189.1 methyltransferase domain-containing protein [Petrocella sp. FN5]
MINKCKFYINMIHKIIKKEVVDVVDYKTSYNDVAGTYACWIEKMGRFTDYIIKPQYVCEKTTNKNEPIKVLDFACGTGYISRKLILSSIPCEITAVDLSDKMLEACKDLSLQGVKLIHMDGMTFLENTTDQFDLILCGWALPYFSHEKLLKNFRRVLKKDGVIGVIANSKGTLDKMDKIFLKIMEKNPQEVHKPMNIAFNLPNGEKGLKRWFDQQGFYPLELHEGESVFPFDTGEALLDWLNQTGVTAGTKMIFKDYDKVKEQLIEEIEKLKYDNGKYIINHKFVYGIFNSRGTT